MDIHIIKNDEQFSNKITNKKIIEYICKRYGLDLQREIRHAIFTNCIHRFVNLNDETYCYKCNLVSACIKCGKNTNNEKQLKNTDNLKTYISKCTECNCTVEWYII